MRLEVRRLRNGQPSPGPADWLEALPIGDGGIGLDSIERLGALGALAEMFDLDDDVLRAEPADSVGDWIDLIMASNATAGGKMTIRTSGSTGVPRDCVHAVADLVEEAAFLATRFVGRRRVVAMVPAHHMYGIIWTALLPAALGIPVVVRAVGTSLGLTAGDLVVAVPDQWQAILRLTRSFPHDVTGVSSASPLDDTVAANLLKAGLSRMVDVYGSSETGGIALRVLPAAAYELMPRWHLQPVDGDDWQLVDEHGYASELPDRIERKGERFLRPIGRRDGAVQVAGHNVWPQRVAQALQSVNGVAAVAVRQHANGRLKAFVVPQEGRSHHELTDMLEQTAARLTEHERPVSFRFGDSLPRNAMGKLEDWT